MGISLLIKGADGQERRTDFDRGKVTIGANALCDVTVADPGVDAEQAVLVERDGKVELFDIGESGGVLVNGKPVGHAVVGPGDEIWVGGTVLSLIAGGEGVSFTEGISTVRAEMPAERAPVVRELEEQPTDERFALLNQVRKLINSIGTTENIFESIVETVFATVPVRRGFIALAGPDGELQVKAHKSRERGAAQAEKISVSRTLVGKVLESGNAVLTSDAEADPSFSAARSIHNLRIKAAICVPLFGGDKVIGLLYGDNRERPGSLNKEHLAILRALASVASVAVEKFRLLKEFEAKQRIEQALAIARSIHRNFLPDRPPESPRYEVWGRSDSCDETGGDYYDFFPTADGRLRVAIADVTGHGIGPALLMATLRASLRALVYSEPSLEKLTARLNELIRADVHDGRFITFFMGNFDQEGFSHVGAGHTPPVWYRARDKTTHLVYSKGPPLGILPELEFAGGTKLPLAPGDVLLFTTDGIIEARPEAGEEFGMQRLRAVLSEHATGSPQEVVEAICAAVDGHVRHEPLRDDATLVAVKVRA